MPVFVGPGAAGGGGFEGQGDRVGIPTATSDPSSANLGDMYYHTVGSGTSLMIYNGTEFVRVNAEDNGTASGGTKTTDGNDTIHTFTSSGSLVVTGSITGASYLLIGGGGGGGGDNSGGGGAGLLRYATGVTLPEATHPVTIGTGGAGSPATNTAASDGNSSTFAISGSPVSSPGGGKGGTGNTGQHAGSNGGSGGGGAGETPASNNSGGTGNGDSGHPSGTDVASPPNGWGNDGGGNSASGGGGGGGAAGVGANAPSTNIGGPGGNGATYTISGSPVTYAGGGGGGNENDVGPPFPSGGPGGGGPGKNGPGPGKQGTDGLGAGGGGGTYWTPNSPEVTGGPGGDGVLIVRYPNTK